MFWLNWPSSGDTAKQKKLHQQVHMKGTEINFEDSDHHNRRTAIFVTLKTPEDGQLSRNML
jgi:hypothetical protein